MFNKTNTTRGLAAFVALVAALAIFVGSALANTVQPPAAPSTTTVVENLSDVAQVSSSSSSKTTLTVLSYEKANGMSKAEQSKAKAAGQCRWIGDGTDVPTYWNSGRAANGTLFWFLDHKHVYECNMRKVKCGNLLRFTAPKSHIVHGIVVMVKSFGKFTASVRAQASAKASAWCGSASSSASANGSLSGRTRLEARGNAKLLANVKAHLSASAKASAQVHCGQQSTTTTTTTPGQPQICTDKDASNYNGVLPCVYPPAAKCTDSKATNYNGLAPCTYPPAAKCTDSKATNYNGSLPCVYPPPPTCQTPGATNIGGSLPCTFPPTCQDHSATNYGGSLPCKYPPPPPPTCTDHSATNYGGALPCQYPVVHHTYITCTTPEEISGGGSAIIVCNVSSDNGAAVSLKANAGNSNSRISGINCYSENGAPSCSTNGTYNLTIVGNNDGSTILYSSFTVTATANGVSETFTSDSFPVDPSGGGF